MDFVNCKNPSKIRYKIEPALGVSSDAAQGLLPLVTPSTATGVVVQIMDSAAGGTPVVTALNTWREINTSASSYSVPLRARYVRTGTQGVGQAVSKRR